MPVFRVAVGVFEGEGEDGAAFLDGVFAVFLALEGVGKEVEGGGGGVGVCSALGLVGVLVGWREGRWEMGGVYRL